MLEPTSADVRAVPGARRSAALLWSMLSLLAACLLAAPTARADTAIALDLEGLVPVDAPETVDSGPSWSIRLGQQLHLPFLTLTPEIGFNYASFGDGPTLYRGIAGARVGFGELFRLGVFAHIGFGHLSIDFGPADYSYTDFTFDAGLFLDLTIIPLLDVGIHMSYGNLASDGDEPLSRAVQWLAFGAHIALIL